MAQLVRRRLWTSVALFGSGILVGWGFAMLMYTSGFGQQDTKVRQINTSMTTPVYSTARQPDAIGAVAPPNEADVGSAAEAPLPVRQGDGWMVREEQEQAEELLAEELDEEIARCDQPLRVVSADCSQEPCVGILRNVREGNLVAYSHLTSCSSFDAVGAMLQDCGDGTSDRLVLAVEAGFSLTEERRQELYQQFGCR